ncbi:MAG TPA: hypothetical protein VE225_01890, partial [Rubrobacteraceae bacterium]|nr:hypothetical protein [Rubrobacteraceae bacterium]
RGPYLENVEATVREGFEKTEHISSSAGEDTGGAREQQRGVGDRHPVQLKTSTRRDSLRPHPEHAPPEVRLPLRELFVDGSQLR